MIAKMECNAVTTSYEDCRPIILCLCKRWCKRSGVDWDTALSAANLGFMEAYEKYDSSRGSFASFVWKKVQFALKDTVRPGQTRFGVNVSDISRVSCDSELNADEVVQKPTRWFEHLYQEAGEDCKVLLNCLMENPSELKFAFCHDSVRGIKRELRKKTGFSTDRFKRSFLELKSLVVS